MAQYSLITRSQLDKIREQAMEQTLDSVQEQRQKLKQLSDERASRWPNTLQAQRARKERARLERLAAEEAERVEIDRREAELRAEERRLQIERANKILFDETDRVKGFHSKMLQSDTIRENQELVDFKKQVEALKKAQEHAFVEQQKQALEMAEAAELRKLEEIKKRALEQKAMQMTQLEELKTKILTERAENKREGQLLRQRAVEEAQELRQKEADRIAKAKQLNEDTKNANRALQQFRLKELERQHEAELAIEAYSKKKAEMIAERERREAEKRAKKDADRKRIADMMERNYIDFMSSEQARLERDVAQAEQRSAADEVARRKRIADTIASIDASNKLQLKQKKEAKAKALQEDLDFASEWAQRTKELKDEEECETRERLERNRKLASYQLHQAEVKARKQAAAKIAELQEAAQIQLSLAEQEDIFQRYAAACIEEYSRLSKSTVPMELHLKKKTTVETMS